MIDIRDLTGEKRERMIRATMLGDPSVLLDLDEHAIFLHEILHGPYSVVELDGKLQLLHIKALVARMDGLKIEIYPDEHPPPHFHVRSANINASFRIDDCTKIEGELSGSQLKKIRYWHGYSKQVLIQKWDEMRPTECAVGEYRDN